MTAFTEMGPGLQYLMNPDPQSANGSNMQPYSFMYGNPHQIVPNYQPHQRQQQQQQPQQQQQQQPQQQSNLPTPPGSPRPLNVATNQINGHQSNVKNNQNGHSAFTSPARHASQVQSSLPIYPQPSPLNQNHQSNNMEQNSLFVKQQPVQPQQFQWPNQTSYPVNEEIAFPPAPTSTSPSLVHAISQATQQRRQRSEKKQVPDDLKDDKYYERRKRNNVAAKKSRDCRKAREDEISIRASFLEKENAILRAQVTTLREEASSLRQLLLQKQTNPSNTTASAQLGPRPAATSTPNPKQPFSLNGHQQASNQQPQQLAATLAQQAAAYAAAFSNMQQQPSQSQQQEMINSAA